MSGRMVSTPGLYRKHVQNSRAPSDAQTYEQLFAIYLPEISAQNEASLVGFVRFERGQRSKNVASFMALVLWQDTRIAPES